MLDHLELMNPVDGVEQVRVWKQTPHGSVDMGIRAARPGEVKSFMREIRDVRNSIAKTRADIEEADRNLHVGLCRDRLRRRFALLGTLSHRSEWLRPGFYWEARLSTEGSGILGWFVLSTSIYRWKDHPDDQMILRDTWHRPTKE